MNSRWIHRKRVHVSQLYHGVSQHFVRFSSASSRRCLLKRARPFLVVHPKCYGFHDLTSHIRLGLPPWLTFFVYYFWHTTNDSSRLLCHLEPVCAARNKRQTRQFPCVSNEWVGGGAVASWSSCCRFCCTRCQGANMSEVSRPQRATGYCL